MSIKIPYEEYKDFPKASSFSRKMSLLCGFIIVLGICIALLIIPIAKWSFILSIVIIAFSVTLSIVLSKYKEKQIHEILKKERKKKDYNDYERLMELQAEWRKDVKIAKMDENDPRLLTIAKQQGISPSKVLEIYKMRAENYMISHKIYNREHINKVPFPKDDE